MTGVLDNFNIDGLMRAEKMLNQSTQLIRVMNSYRVSDVTLEYTIESGQSSGMVYLIDSQYEKSYYGRKNKFDATFKDSNGILCPPGFNIILFDSTLQPNHEAFDAGLSTIRFLIETQLVADDGSLGSPEYARGYFKQQTVVIDERTPYSMVMGFHSENYRLITPKLNAMLSSEVNDETTFNIYVRRPQLISINIATESQTV